MAGYHKKHIEKGVIGEFSKVLEEIEEIKDAVDQGCKIMELVELSDLYGAIELYVENKHQISMNDLKVMSDITKRAFNSGARK